MTRGDGPVKSACTLRLAPTVRVTWAPVRSPRVLFSKLTK